MSPHIQHVFIRALVSDDIFGGFSVSLFVLLCSSHFVGSFQSCSHLHCLYRHAILVM